jgi:hypothetical protein
VSRPTTSAVIIADATPSIRRCKIKKTWTTIARSSFRLHLFQGDPPSTGIVSDDGAVYSVKDGVTVCLGPRGPATFEGIFVLRPCAAFANRN